MERNKPIGVFDSGVGGLTVVREIMRQLPNEHIIYFGDTARVPYGSKSKDTVTRYAEQIIRFLLKEDVKAIVIACNTATAYALEEVSKMFKIPIIGVIKPGAISAVEASKNNNIGVIGTEGTVNSMVYDNTIKSINPNANIISKACPLLCPLVEEGWLKDSVTKEVIKRYLSPLLNTDIDTLIMGCTHYPLLRSTFLDVIGENITLINPAYETAIDLKELLEKDNLLREDNNINSNVPYKFFVSDTADKFKDFANSILPIDVRTIMKIQIESY